VIRKPIAFFLTIVAIVTGATIVSQAQSLLTRHMRDATLNGQAPSGSREEIGYRANNVIAKLTGVGKLRM
jgi:hypothetical protein